MVWLMAFPLHGAIKWGAQILRTHSPVVTAPDAPSLRLNILVGLVNWRNILWLLKKSVSLKTTKILGIENVYLRRERRL
jgi:hypothetical protein